MKFNGIQINLSTSRCFDRSIELYMFVSSASLLDRLIGTRYTEYHCTAKRHVLRNKSSKCYRKLRALFFLSVFTRFSPFFLHRSFVCWFFRFLFPSAILFLGTSATGTMRQQFLLADWLFRLIAFCRNDKDKLQCNYVEWDRRNSNNNNKKKPKLRT